MGANRKVLRHRRDGNRLRFPRLPPEIGLGMLPLKGFCPGWKRFGPNPSPLLHDSFKTFQTFLEILDNRPHKPVAVTRNPVKPPVEVLHAPMDDLPSDYEKN
jgi:hypothetical protein